jgi:hypothetical protein
MQKSPNVTRALAAIFCGFGLLFSGAGLYIAIDQRSFLRDAAHAQGVVIDHRHHYDMQKRTHDYAPTVRFSLPNGEEMLFTSNQAKSSKTPAVGASVDVLYLPNRPRRAELANVAASRLPLIVFGGIGGIVLAVGVGLGISDLRKSMRKRRLLAVGLPVESTLVAVERNDGVAYKGKNPWRLRCSWRDPATGITHEFLSDDIWFDPGPHLTMRNVRVLLDPGRPSRYWVDLSFLDMRG